MDSLDYEKLSVEELKDAYISGKFNKNAIERELVKRGFSDFLENRKNKEISIRRHKEEYINRQEKNKKNIVKYFFYFFLFFLLYLFNFYTNLPKVFEYDYNEINYLIEPKQLNISNEEMIIKKHTLKIEGIDEKKYKSLEIIPLAEYKISARIASKRKYYDYGSGIIKYDLALVWGKYAQKENMKKVKYRQGFRWYLFSLKKDSNLNVEEVSKHSANTHVAAANKNIKKAFEKSKKNDIIELEGYLVRIKWKDKKGRDYNWASSLTRDDTGKGACEVMYVNKIRIGKKIYK